mmetsp:Transcript_59748/g.174679  ORF Transcript_59748/g.174679 Transcript_59748/m.174679 type:complete len:357 (+) Transcript_59748:939-2009(+)
MGAANGVRDDLLRDRPYGSEPVAQGVRGLGPEGHEAPALHGEAHAGQAPGPHVHGGDAGGGVLAPGARPALLHGGDGLRLASWARNTDVLGHRGPLVEHPVPRARLLPLPAPDKGERAYAARICPARAARGEVARHLLRRALFDVGVPDRQWRLPMACGSKLCDCEGAGPAGVQEVATNAKGGVAVSVDAQKVNGLAEPDDVPDLVLMCARQHKAHRVLGVLGLHRRSHPVQAPPEAVAPGCDGDLHLDLIANGPPEDGGGVLETPDCLKVRGQLPLPERVGIHVGAILVMHPRMWQPDACGEAEAMGLRCRDGFGQVRDAPCAHGVGTVRLCSSQSPPASSSANRPMVAQGAVLG